MLLNTIRVRWLPQPHYFFTRCFIYTLSGLAIFYKWRRMKSFSVCLSFIFFFGTSAYCNNCHRIRYFHWFRQDIKIYVKKNLPTVWYFLLFRANTFSINEVFKWDDFDKPYFWVWLWRHCLGQRNKKEIFLKNGLRSKFLIKIIFNQSKGRNLEPETILKSSLLGQSEQLSQSA